MGYTPTDPESTKATITVDQDIDAFRLVSVKFSFAPADKPNRVDAVWQEGFERDGEFHVIRQKEGRLDEENYDALMAAVTASGALSVELDTAVWAALQSAGEVPVGTVT